MILGLVRDIGKLVASFNPKSGNNRGNSGNNELLDDKANAIDGTSASHDVAAQTLSPSKERTASPESNSRRNSPNSKRSPSHIPAGNIWNAISRDLRRQGKKKEQQLSPLKSRSNRYWLLYE